MSFSFYPRTVFKTKSKYNSSIVVKEQFGKHTLHVNGIIQSGGLVKTLWKKALRKLLINCHFEELFRHPEESVTKDPVLDRHPEWSLAESRDLSRHTRCLKISRQARDDEWTTNGGIFRAVYPELCRKAKNDDGPRILILGLGGGTLVKLLRTKYSNCKIIGVEIDKEIINIGKKYFGFNKVDSLTVVHVDAVKFIKKHCFDDLNHQSRYNMIFVDLYCGKEVCPDLLKKEFIMNIKKLLLPKGLVMINWLKVKNGGKLESNLRSIFSEVESKEVFSNKFYYCS